MTDEKDDLVERCAEAIQEQFSAVSAAGARMFAETVLEAAGFERLRAALDETRKVLDLNPGVYDSEVPHIVAYKLEKREEELADARHHNAALNTKLEGEKRVSQLLRERVAKLESVHESSLLSARALYARFFDPATQTGADAERRGWFQLQNFEARSWENVAAHIREALSASSRQSSMGLSDEVVTRVAPSGGDSGHPDDGLLGSQVIRDVAAVLLALGDDPSVSQDEAKAAAERLKERYR